MQGQERGRKQGQQLPGIVFSHFLSTLPMWGLGFFFERKQREITVSRTLQGEKKHSLKCTYQTIMGNI